MQISWVGQSTKHHGATPIQDGIFIISIQVLRCPILYMFPLFIEISKLEHGVKITLATGYVRLWSCRRLPVQSVGNCSSVRTQFVGCGSPTSAAVLCSPLYSALQKALQSVLLCTAACPVVWVIHTPHVGHHLIVEMLSKIESPLVSISSQDCSAFFCWKQFVFPHISQMRPEKTNPWIHWLFTSE